MNQDARDPLGGKRLGYQPLSEAVMHWRLRQELLRRGLLNIALITQCSSDGQEGTNG